MNTISSTERYLVVFQSTGGLVTDPKDLEPLTPDHFIVITPGSFSSTRCCRKKSVVFKAKEAASSICG